MDERERDGLLGGRIRHCDDYVPDQAERSGVCPDPYPTFGSDLLSLDSWQRLAIDVNGVSDGAFHMSTPTHKRERGQVLPIAAMMMVVLMAISALAIDVSRKYSEERSLRSAADAAALAGAQDLQIGGRKATPNAADYARARTRASDLLVRQFGGSGVGPGAACLASSNMDCTITGTSLRFTITTPYPGCVSCKPEQAMKVAVTNPSFATTFARVVGQTNWVTSQTSVAGSIFGANYSIVMLRPPDILASNLSDKNRADFEINGGANLIVTSGDVGSNTSIIAPSNSTVDLETGYFAYHRDIGGEQDFKDAMGNHPARLMPSPFVVDPQYSVPVDPVTQFAKQDDGKISCLGLTPAAPVDATSCYLPGTYTNKQPFDIKAAEVVYLTPGIYSFPTGLNINGTLKGGVTTGYGAVTLILPCCAVGANFYGASSEGIFLNTAAVIPTAAQGPGGIPLTLIVRRNESCFTGAVPILCSGNQNNQVLQLSGGGTMQIGGIQYAPSDNIQIGGTKSVGTGTIGQIVSWTLKVNNGTIRQEGVANDTPGILRLDQACSPTSACP